MSSVTKQANDRMLAYDNSFNKVKLGMLTTNEYNLLFAIMSIVSDVKPDENGEIQATISMKQVREVLGVDRIHQNRVIKSLDKLLSIKVHFYVDGDFISANMFSHYKIANNRKEFIIQLAPHLTKMLSIKSKINDGLDVKYSLIDLYDLSTMRSVRSKELYKRLRQYRNTGKFMINTSEFLDYLFIDENKYTDYKIIRDYLMPAVEDNKKFFANLQVNIEGNATKLPNVLVFTFDYTINALEESDDLYDYSDESEEFLSLLEYVRANSGILED